MAVAVHAPSPGAQQLLGLHELLKQIEALELERARALVVGELPRLRLGAQLESLMVQQCLAQRSCEALADALTGLLAFSELAGTRQPPVAAALLRRLAVRPATAAEDSGYAMLPVERSRTRSWDARCLDGWSTGRGRQGCPSTRSTSISGLTAWNSPGWSPSAYSGASSGRWPPLSRRLDPDRFVTVHQSVVVNMERVVAIDPTTSNVNVVVVALADDSRESLAVSRRCYARLKSAVGIPGRASRTAPRQR